ncbi:hypothetical protein MFIFM68171_06650 [Madurella fahalii]|uniref:Uncharacterized protein n=1 Tax=Madurella fahalii TaxID=1157608 RepID=A0ABQ0GFV6_9PEZI
MATPAEIMLDKLDGQWAMNHDLSDNTDPMLTLQGIPWLAELQRGASLRL